MWFDNMLIYRIDHYMWNTKFSNYYIVLKIELTNDENLFSIFIYIYGFERAHVLFRIYYFKLIFLFENLKNFP